MSRTTTSLDHDPTRTETNAEPATRTVLKLLRERIVTGQIPSGSRLTAERLADQIGVSRTPVRSALAVLSADGLVNYAVNRGYTVRDLVLADILDAIEVRAVLESKACGLSVDYGWSGAELEQLRFYVATGREIVEAGTWSESIEYEWYKANRALHLLVIVVSRNIAMRNAVRMTLIYPMFGDVVRLCPVVALGVPPRYRQLPPFIPDYVRQSQQDHQDMLDAIEREDAPAVERLMYDHVMRTKLRISSVATRR